jgi:hypothetical protein
MSAPSPLTADPIPAAPARRRKLIITIDTEALPGRSPERPVDQLIWGRFGAAEMGIGRMMAIANRYAAPLTFFVDFCEAPLYPGAFESVCQAIRAEGHDLQLHAHPHILPLEFCRARGLSNSSLHQQPPEKAHALFDFLLETASRLGGNHPIAFRGGAFAYNEAMLAAMAEFGVSLDFSYNSNSKYQANNTHNLPVFRWSNGITEFPMSVLRIRRDLRPFEFGSFSSLRFSDAEAVHAYLNQYFAELGDDAVLVLLLHSWSFLYLNRQTGCFEHQDDRLAGQFDRFLAGLPRDIEVLSASQAAALVRNGSFAPALVRDVDQANFSRHGCGLKSNTK